MTRKAVLLISLILLAALLLVACDNETDLTEETYAAMTVELIRAGFIGPEADAVYEKYEVSPERYEQYSKELEKDPGRQQRVSQLLKDEIGDDWEDWGRAFGEAFAKLGYNFGELAVEFGESFVSGFMEYAPQMQEALEEMARGLEETFRRLQRDIEEKLGDDDDEASEVVGATGEV